MLSSAAVPCRAHFADGRLVVAMNDDFYPFTFINTRGEPAGMFVDMWRLWGEKNGYEMTFLASNWETSLENLKSGRAQIHAGLFASPGRAGWMAPTRQIYHSEVSYFHPVYEGEIAAFEKLEGQTVAVIQGGEPEEFLQRQYPRIRRLSVATREELLTATHEGKANGFLVLAPVGEAMIEHSAMAGYFDKQSITLYSDEFHPGVLRKNPELAAVVDQGMKDVSPAELKEIEARWIADPEQRHGIPSDRISLAVVEQNWLKKNRVIRVGISPPVKLLNFNENGIVNGIEADYLQEIAARTGLKFLHVICPFGEMDARMLSGEIDMFLSVMAPMRLSYAGFTEPLLHSPLVIVGRLDSPYLRSVDNLNGKRLAVVKGNGLEDKLFGSNPGIRVIPYHTIEEKFRAVATGKADTLVSNILFAAYYLNYFPNLKIAGLLGSPPEPYLFAVRKDYPELVAILNKAIAAIPGERRNEILQKRQSVRIESGLNWNLVRKWGYVAGAGVTLVLLVSFFWHQRLRRNRLQLLSAEFELRELQAREKREEEIAELREAVEEEERFRIAREIHDSSGQTLQAIRLHLKLLADGKGEGDMRQDLNMLAGEVADTANELREISHQLRPSYLRRIPLDEAISNRCSLLRRRGIPVRVATAGDFSNIPYRISDNFYRIFQESLANASRHAKAGHIRISLEHADSVLRLTVADDGCGIDAGSPQAGIGLQIMKERANIIAADLSVTSDGGGTVISLVKEGI